MNIESLVGKRFNTCEDIANKIEQLTGTAVWVQESESDVELADFILDYEYRDSKNFNTPISEVGEIYYLKDRQGHYYITEVMNININR